MTRIDPTTMRLASQNRGDALAASKATTVVYFFPSRRRRFLLLCLAALVNLLPNSFDHLVMAFLHFFRRVSIWVTRVRVIFDGVGQHEIHIALDEEKTQLRQTGSSDFTILRQTEMYVTLTKNCWSVVYCSVSILRLMYVKFIGMVMTEK